MTDTITFYLQCTSMLLDNVIPGQPSTIEESETPEGNWRATYTRNPKNGRIDIIKLDSSMGEINTGTDDKPVMTHIWGRDQLPSATVAHLAEQIRRMRDEAEMLANDDVDVIDEETRLPVRKIA